MRGEMQEKERGMIETISHAGSVLAIILRREFRRDGIEFFTPPEFSQQLAYMRRPAGYVIRPHLHKEVQREVMQTREVLLIKSGRVRVDFYDNDRHYLRNSVLESGDVVLLAEGGHGFEMLEQSEIIEIKQGPYAGDSDKTTFDP